MSEVSLDDLTPHDRRVVKEYQSALRAKHLAKQGPKQPLDELTALRQESEQLRELIAIVDTMLYHDAVSGEWPNEQCRYCGGHSSGYWDSQTFVHGDECAVEKMRALRK